MPFSFEKYQLEFKRPSGTSRGILKLKDSWFLKIWEATAPDIVGFGECSVISGLSPDQVEDFESVLEDLPWSVGLDHLVDTPALIKYPALRTAVEMALLDLRNGGRQIYFDSAFVQGKSHIDINGLIWMGDPSFMRAQVRDKIDQGFRCIKLKIGAIDFDTELDLLHSIRKEYSKDDIELRVDANGAFHPDGALNKLGRLSELALHSIEQPIRQGQITEMARLCEQTPLPIALDEELIGVENKAPLIDAIRPQYIILKPSLLGGFAQSRQWIDLAESADIGWWVTSALESNVGLNAIAQWTATLDTSMYQGLGTGLLYTNNVEAPIYLDVDRLRYLPR